MAKPARPRRPSRKSLVRHSGNIISKSATGLLKAATHPAPDFGDFRPNMSFWDFLEESLFRLIYMIFRAILLGLLVFIMIAFGIPLLFAILGA